MDDAERRIVERVLGDAWGDRVRIQGADIVAERRHVVRVTATDGRVAIVKRPRDADSAGRWGREPDGLTTEWAALDLLGLMPEPVAPRLLGGDADRRLVVVEELPADRTLADSLLGDDAGVTRTDLVAYAEALAGMGAWSIGRTDEHRATRRRRGLDPDAGSWWGQVVGRFTEAFLEAARGLGLATDRLEPEINEIVRTLDGRDGNAAVGLVHGDPCPDNVILVDGRCRLLDFERSSWGSLALDAGYLVAPFPSCWCFGRLPAGVAEPAVAAYQARLAAAVGPLGAEWDRAVAAALAGWVVVRAHVLSGLGDPDGDGEEWGTATMRPRLRSWLAALLAAPGADAFPHMHGLASGLADQVHTAWPEIDVPGYPAFVAAEVE